MADKPDVCASCSVVFDDVKSIIQCSSCSKYYHPKCEKVPNLRGFHKKSSWKCGMCLVVATPEDIEGKACKRLRSEHGSMVEVDKNLLQGLYSTVSDLKFLTTELNNKVTELQKSNISLGHRVELLSTRLLFVTSYQQPFTSTTPADKKNVNINNATDPSKENELSVPTKPVNKTKTDARSYARATKSRKTSISEPAVNSRQLGVSTLKNDGSETESDSDGFQTVARTKSRRSLIVGSKILPHTVGSKSTSTLEGTERRKWLHVGRVKAGTTPNSVVDYVKSSCGSDDVLCFAIFNNDKICSFKVGVPESSYQGLLDAKVWPKGVTVRDFINRPKVNASQATRTSRQKEESEATEAVNSNNSDQNFQSEALDQEQT